MIQPLIFTEQRLFPRALDSLLTIVAWLGFGWLIYSGLITAIEHNPFMGTRPFYTTLSTLSIYLLVACLISL
ncbi:MAG TPA: poly-beta-1,6-N-acetyl-D-glucosamine biosynthesis protein PgaD, partial [Leclercia sp.]|nr:poly-beta-1,6-N-acetyl-D-glucosamine biosynthesis protein PgaD [Leclercia sp.]